MNNLETERKFLIKMPSLEKLSSLSNIQKVDIIQTYTTIGVRLRRWEENGEISYIKTEKTKLTDLTRIEIESKITKEEYQRLTAFADKECNPIEKIRYRYPFMEKLIEIDVFPFWSKQAFCEVELQSEDEEFLLPDFIEVIREVTHDKHYRNYSLAKKIPKEDNF